MAGIPLLYCVLNEINRKYHGRGGDFIQFYRAAKDMVMGHDIYTHGYIYPPFFAFMLTPLAHLSEEFASILWTVVNFSLLILIVVLGFRILTSVFKLTFNRWSAIGVCSLALLLTSYELFMEFHECQSDLLILAGIVLGLYWVDRKPFIAGICLGVVASIKYQSIVFLPLLIFRARWLAVAGLMAGAVGAALLPALFIGWNRNLEYLLIAIRGIANSASPAADWVGQAANVPSILWEKNISISAGLTRIFIDYGLSKQDLYLFLLVITAAIFFSLWWMFRQKNIPFLWRRPCALGDPQQEKFIFNLEWSAVLVGMLILSPQCAVRHLILLLNVNLLAAVMLLFPRPNLQRWPVLMGVLIFQLGLLLPIPLKQMEAWRHVGGLSWCILIFLFAIVSSGLAYYRDLYGTRPQRLLLKPDLPPNPLSLDGRGLG